MRNVRDALLMMVTAGFVGLGGGAVSARVPSLGDVTENVVRDLRRVPQVAVTGVAGLRF